MRKNLCPLCQDKGIRQLQNGRDVICFCKYGKNLRLRIQQGENCPVCQDTGISDVDENDKVFYCLCYHGLIAKIKKEGRFE